MAALPPASGQPTSTEILDLMRAGRHDQAAERMAAPLAADFASAFLSRKQVPVALIYLRSAAYRNEGAAQLALARILAKDGCGAKDPMEAYAWASLHRSAEAQALKAELANDLNAEELAHAEGRAADLVQRLHRGEMQGWQQALICARPVGEPVSGAPALCSYQCAPAPEYPSAARRAEATGVVGIDFGVRSDGSVATTAVRKSAGSSREHKQLDRTTEDFVRSCRFLSKTLSVEKTYGVEYRWALR